MTGHLPPRRFEAVVENLTEGLRHDRDLRDEVRQELLSHLESALAASDIEGAEDERVDAVLASFGADDALAKEIYRANRGRMRWRAIARGALQWGLVPGVLIAAAVLVFVRDDLFLRANLLWSPDVIKFPVVRDRIRRRDAEADRLQALRRAWEREPASVQRYARYVFALPYSCTDAELEGHFDISPAQVRTALECGRTLDPGNGFYDLALALYYMRRAVVAGEEFSTRDPHLQPGSWLDAQHYVDGLSPKDREGRHRVYVARVVDGAAFDFALGHLRSAVASPRLTSYAREDAVAGLAALPPTDLATMTTRLKTVMERRVYPLLALQDLLHALPAYLRRLPEPARLQLPTDPLLRAPSILACRIAADATSACEVVVAYRLALQAKTVATALAELGHGQFAAGLRLECDVLERRWRDAEALEAPIADALIRRLRSEGGELASLLVPDTWSSAAVDTDLSATRELDYLSAEHIAALVLLLLFAVAIAIYGGRCVLSALRQGSLRHVVDLPDRHEVLRLIWMVAFPLAAYHLYTRGLGWADRTLPLLQNFHRPATEILAVVLVVFGGATYLGLRSAVRRGRVRGEEVPASLFRGYALLLLSALVIGGMGVGLALAPLAWMGGLLSKGWEIHDVADVTFAVLALGGGLVTVLAFLQFTHAFRFRAFAGRLHRACVPFWALAAALALLFTSPYLSREESRIIADLDNVIGVGHEFGMSKVEAEGIQSRRRLITDAAEGR